MQLPVSGQRQAATCFRGGLQSWPSWWAVFCALGNGCARELHHPGTGSKLKQLPMKQTGTLNSYFSVFSQGKRPITDVDTLAYPPIFQWTNCLIHLNRTQEATKARAHSCDILLCRREYASFLEIKQTNKQLLKNTFIVCACVSHSSEVKRSSGL